MHSAERSLEDIARSMKALVKIAETMNTNLVMIGRDLAPPKADHICIREYCTVCREAENGVSDDNLVEAIERVVELDPPPVELADDVKAQIAEEKRNQT